jgi:hypothetical protein
MVMGTHSRLHAVTVAVTVADLALVTKAESTFGSKYLPYCVDFNVNSFSSVFRKQMA